MNQNRGRLTNPFLFITFRHFNLSSEKADINILHIPKRSVNVSCTRSYPKICTVWKPPPATKYLSPIPSDSSPDGTELESNRETGLQSRLEFGRYEINIRKLNQFYILEKLTCWICRIYCMILKILGGLLLTTDYINYDIMGLKHPHQKYLEFGAHSLVSGVKTTMS